MDRADELAPRTLGEPSMSRLPEDTPHRDEILTAHKSALSKHEAGYLDPVTGLFVLSAAYLAARGYCCERGCRHCPYVMDERG
jgi:hypothetical protein